MAIALERFMAEKRKVGRPPSGKPSNVGKMTRLAPEVVGMGKLVAASKGVNLSDYFSEILRGVVERDYAAMLRKLEKQGEK